MTTDHGGNWFDDDPEWADLRRRIDGQPAPKQKKKPHSKDKQQKPSKEFHIASKPSSEVQIGETSPKKVELSVNVTLPKPKIPKLPKLSHRQMIVGGSVAGALIVGIIGFNVISGLLSDDKKEVAGASTTTEPTFDTVLPEGEKEKTSSKKLGFDAERQVASFTDNIGNVAITVSQQPLPEPFKANPDEEVKKLAEGFSANEVINESNPKAYLGTDEKGPQTVIFHKNGLLVFIQSASKLDKEQWSEYITKLL